MTGFSIGSRHVGDGSPCLVVAEVAQAHEGSLGMAHAYVDAVAKAGADAIKFQLHLPEFENMPDEPWRVVPEWPQDASRYDYWKRTAFDANQLWSLAAHAEAKGLIFLCSAFSEEGVKILNPLVPAWKIASGEVTNYRLFYAITQTKKPVILSTGMSTMGEIKRALEVLRLQAPGRLEAALLQCTSAYPCPADQIGLRNIPRMKRRFDRPVGLSDHSGTIFAGLGAVALGANILEVHVCFNRQEFGFDVSSSITVDELAELVKGARFLEKARNPVRKNWIAEDLEPMRELFMRRHERLEALEHQKTAGGATQPFDQSASSAVPEHITG